MKCFLVFALVCCLTPQSIIASHFREQRDSKDPAILTILTCTISKVCNPAGAMVFMLISNALADGMLKFNESKEMTEGFREAGASVIRSFDPIFGSSISLLKGAAEVDRDLVRGKSLRDSVIARTTEGIQYVANQFSKNPKGDYMNAMIAGGNVALTLSVGPVHGWAAAVITKAATDGSEHYRKTQNINQATQIAAESAYNSVSYLCNIGFNALKNAGGFLMDVKRGKGAMNAAKDRGADMLNAVASGLPKRKLD